MNIKEYGVKKTWDGWRSYALVKDYGNYLKLKKKLKILLKKKLKK